MLKTKKTKLILKTVKFKKKNQNELEYSRSLTNRKNN